MQNILNILSIHTAFPQACITLSHGNEVTFLVNDTPKEHAAFLHTGIEKLLKDAGVATGQIDAVGVTSGPGSYTGIRVGMAAAKGLCFALHIPLITIATLEALAFVAISMKKEPNALYIPLVAARKTEVFSAVYDSSLHVRCSPEVTDLQVDHFQDFGEMHSVYFFGSGSTYLQERGFFNSTCFIPLDDVPPSGLAAFTLQKFNGKEFEALALAEAAYLKDAYVTKPSKK